MKLPILLLLAFLCAVPPAAAQHAAPAGVRRLEHGPVLLELTPVPTPAPTSFRFKPVVMGAVIGAMIVAPIGWLLAQGACEANNCGSGRRGLVAGAAAGAVLGGLFGVIVALPPGAE